MTLLLFLTLSFFSIYSLSLCIFINENGCFSLHGGAQEDCRRWASRPARRSRWCGRRASIINASSSPHLPASHPMAVAEKATGASFGAASGSRWHATKLLWLLLSGRLLSSWAMVAAKEATSGSKQRGQRAYVSNGSTLPPLPSSWSTAVAEEDAGDEL
jgi:hypothetical protein